MIDKLQDATGGSRELDAEISTLVGIATVATQYSKLRDPFGKSDEMVTVMECNALRYTTSIDAAMTLVPKGCWVEIKGPRRYLNIPSPVPNYWSANIETWNHEGQKMGWGATPALALCIAALKAKDNGHD
jgi:hypothetical protein